MHAYAYNNMALFDVRIVDTEVQSFMIHTPKSVLCSAEIEKKRKYSAACSAHWAHFTPLCFLVDGLTGGEASSLRDLLVALLLGGTKAIVLFLVG